MTKKIQPGDLMCMDECCGKYPVEIELAYAYDRPPNIFGPIYRPDARLWLWRPLGECVLHAAQNLYKAAGLKLRLYDGLRTVDAQAKMQDTEICKKNPHWFEEPRLLSPPGAGAHPRAMAIDCALVDDHGNMPDMGTAFDHLSENSGPQHNPAHRSYEGLTPEVKANRNILNHAMQKGAQSAGIDLVLLDTEWWDFRLPRDFYEQYQPLSDADLPPEMRMVGT